jgi:hypothetical protein
MVLQVVEFLFRQLYHEIIGKAFDISRYKLYEHTRFDTIQAGEIIAEDNDMAQR